MIKLREAVVVEGKYDKIKLKSFLDCPIIETNGFRVFSDKDKQSLIRAVAKKRGIVIMTDSDSAGLVIRNFLKGIVPPDKIKNCYVPLLSGKEKRKAAPSKEGLLGVEGIDEKTIVRSLEKCGVFFESTEDKDEKITKQDLYFYGLCGREDSGAKRRKILLSLDFPAYLSANAFLDMINVMFSKEDFENFIKEK